MLPSKHPVVWITGLAGSGKTSLARALVSELRAVGRSVVHVDGDQVRTLMGDGLGYGPEHRLENAYRIARLCAFLQGEGVFTVCSTMSLYPEIWRFNRERLAPYLQVFLDVPMSELERRDQKGLYSGVGQGTARDVGGVDLALELPLDSDLVLSNQVEAELMHNVALILAHLARPEQAAGGARVCA
jgi:adenylylsulfate kinase-like enzyme